jgi:protease YdgD
VAWRAIAPLLLLLAAAAGAQERRPLGGEEGLAFLGVGRLNVAGRRFCTATLIEPAVIVTAAHCLFHPRTRERVPIDEFRFAAGYRRGEAVAVGRPVRAAVHPDFVYAGEADYPGVQADLALLELAEPVPAEVAAAFAPAALAEGEPLAIVSYARDRAHLPSIEAPCEVFSTFGAVAALGCAVNYGASGAPVLQGEGEAARLVAVVSAKGRVLADNGDVTLAVMVAPEIDVLLEALALEE